MSSMAAAMQRHKITIIEKRKSLKPRLVANHDMSVRDITRVLTSIMNHYQCTDLWSLVAPPACGPQQFSWKTPPRGGWMVKCAPVLYELAEIAPNTKILATKMRSALLILWKQKSLTYTEKNMTENDAFDRIDTAVRVVFSMFRTIKDGLDEKLRIFRHLSGEEIQKLQLVLDKIKLPAKGTYEDVEDDADEIPVDRSMALAIVPYGSPARNSETWAISYSL